MLRQRLLNGAPVALSVGLHARATPDARNGMIAVLQRVRRSGLETVLCCHRGALDSVAVRPLAFYLGPLMFGNVIAGWMFGKLISDLAFYGCTIFSYERFKGLLAQRTEEVPDESIEAIAAV